MKKKNPTELLIFGNPRRSRRRKNAGGGFGNHKPGCKCAFCVRAAELKAGAKNMPAPIRGVMEKNPAKKLWYVQWTDDGRKSRSFSKKSDAEKLLAHHKRPGQVVEKVKGSNPTTGFRLHWKTANGKSGSSTVETSKHKIERMVARLRKEYPNTALSYTIEEVKSNPRQKKNPRPRSKFMAARARARRRNPEEAELAVELFQSFHGRDPREVQEKQRSAAMRSDYTALGKLLSLTVETPAGQKAEFLFDTDGVTLASSPDGKQLYCIGGNQNIASCLEPESLEKDLIDLGDCLEVVYLARKIHSNFEPVEWKHKLGEDTGERPRLAFDKLKKELFFIGGAYYIDTSKGVSPGIEN